MKRITITEMLLAMSVFAAATTGLIYAKNAFYDLNNDFKVELVSDLKKTEDKIFCKVKLLDGQANFSFRTPQEAPTEIYQYEAFDEPQVRITINQYQRENPIFQAFYKKEFETLVSELGKSTKEQAKDKIEEFNDKILTFFTVNAA